jgi:hypothetical protein
MVMRGPIQDRCQGSQCVPDETREEGRLRPVTVGRCPDCEAWVAVLRNGTLHTHVDRRVRQPATIAVRS